MSDTTKRVTMEDLLAHRRWVRALALRLASDESAADDLEQDAWLAALRVTDRRIESPRAWLGTVVRNLARTAHRRSERRDRHESAAASRPLVASPEDVVAEAEIQAKLVRAVLELDEPYRATVLLRFFHGLEASEIAARTGTPVETVRTRLKRAIERLRERMDGELGDDRDAWCLLVLGWRPRGPAPTPRPTSGSAASALGGGVLAMTTGGKICLATALLLAVAGAWWFTQSGSDERGVSRGPPASDAAGESATHAAARPRTRTDAAPVVDSVPAPPPVPAGPRVTGQVVDADGKPVGGARVSSMPETLDRTVVLDGSQAVGPRAGMATSSADGTFVVPVDAKSPSVLVVVEATGFSTATLDGIRAGSDVVVRLGRGVAVTGRVIDTRGKPVAGAHVRVLQTHETAEVVRTTTSAADGAYRVEGLPAFSQGNWTVKRAFDVRANGFAPLLVETAREPAGPFDLVVVRGATLNVHVVDAESGDALPDAHVLCWSIEGQTRLQLHGGGYAYTSLHQRRLGEGTTATDGTLALPHVPAEGFHPTASFNVGQDGRFILGFVSAWLDGWALSSEYVSLPRDETTVEITVKLRAAAAVEGVAVGDDGRPLSGGDIWVDVDGYKGRCVAPDGMVGLPVSGATISADGTFRVTGIPALRSGPVTAHVTARNAVVGFEWTSGKADVAVRAGETVRGLRIVVPVQRKPTAIVVVEDAEGRAVPGAIVRAVLDGPIMEGRTDADGRTLLVLPAKRGASKDRVARTLPVRVQARGFATTVADVAADTESPPETRIRVVPGRSIVGRVEDTEGRPIDRVTVTVTAPPTPASRTEPTSRDGAPATPMPNQLASGTTSWDGSFVVDDLPEEPLTLDAIARSQLPPDDRGNARWRRAHLDGAQPGGAPVRLVMEKEDVPPTQSLDVIVTDAATGDTLVKARASAECNGSQAWAEEVSPGRLRFERLAQGAWSIRVAGPGRALLRIDGVVVSADVPPTAVSATLRAGAALRGTVHVASGKQPSGCELRLTTTPDDGTHLGTAIASVAADGAFRAEGLSKGRYRVELVPEGEPTEPTPPFVAVGGRCIEIPDSDGETAAEVELIAGATISVAFDSPAVAASPRPIGPAVVIQFCGSDGVVVAECRRMQRAPVWGVPVPPGEITVRLILDGGPPREQRVTVAACERKSVRFTGQ